jgi:hypothetical protein
MIAAHSGVNRTGLLMGTGLVGLLGFGWWRRKA